jgi:hypothetical protein
MPELSKKDMALQMKKENQIKRHMEARDIYLER